MPQQVPVALRHVVRLFVPILGLWHHPNLRDMLQQLFPGCNRVARQQGAKISQPSRHEVANVQQMSVNGIVPSRQKLVSNIPQLLFPFVDRCHKERRRAGCRRGLGQSSQLPFELLLTLTHLRQLVREIGKRALDVVSELVENLLDGLALQDLILQLVQQPSFEPVPPYRDGVRAGPAIEVL
jgi:hypothetical protein